jgi:hypothetical protein
MCRKARHASLEMAEEADGLMRFHADRISVSGTSSDEYNVSKDSTVETLEQNRDY